MTETEAASYVMRGYFPHMSSYEMTRGKVPSRRTVIPISSAKDHSHDQPQVQIHVGLHAITQKLLAEHSLLAHMACGGAALGAKRRSGIDAATLMACFRKHAGIFTEMLPNAHILPFESDYVDRKGFPILIIPHRVRLL